MGMTDDVRIVRWLLDAAVVLTVGFGIVFVM